MSDQKMIEELIKEIEQLKSKLNNVQSQNPLFPVWSENQVTIVGSPQNNYDPGNAGILRINNAANIQITGFTGGVQGRLLGILATANAITLVHQSANSLAENRFDCPNNTSEILTDGEGALLYYDSTALRWRFLGIAN